MALERETPQMIAAEQNAPLNPVHPARICRVALFEDEITTLGVDAIVCPGNRDMTPSPGISGRILAAAGKGLEVICRRLAPCRIGTVKVSGGLHLPCRIILHTVGPQIAANLPPTDEEQGQMKDCYLKALATAVDEELSTIAFPAILSEGDHFPLQLNARIACTMV